MVFFSQEMCLPKGSVCPGGVCLPRKCLPKGAVSGPHGKGVSTRRCQQRDVQHISCPPVNRTTHV